MGRLILKIKMDHPFTIYNYIDKKNNNCGYFIDRSCFSLKIYSIECSTNSRIEIRAVWSRICDLVFSIDNNKEKSNFYADPKNFPSRPRIGRFPRRSFEKTTSKLKFDGNSTFKDSNSLLLSLTLRLWLRPRCCFQPRT